MKKILIAILFVIVVVAVGFVVYRFVYSPWREVKSQKIELGLSSPNFPFRDYSVAELENMHPQVKNADVPTRVTPTQTYVLFREGLKENDLDKVLAQLSPDSARYEENMASIKKAFEEGRFGEIYEKYPEEIEESWTGETISQYEFVETDTDFLHMLGFIKNSDGDWKIDKL